jgi:hypothetical protein
MVGNSLTDLHAKRSAGYRLVMVVLTRASEESLLVTLASIALPCIAELPKLLVFSVAPTLGLVVLLASLWAVLELYQVTVDVNPA